MINRMARSLAALIGATALTLGMTAGAASATETDYPNEFTVTLVDCRVTVQANSIPYNVSSGTRTAGLAIRVNGETVAYTKPEAMANSAYTFDESLSFGPVVDEDLVEFRWFAGPVRNDLPAWNTADHPDWADTVVEREATEKRHWDARDSAPFVTWYTFEVTGCPAPSPDPSPSPSPSLSPTASPDPSASPSSTASPSPDPTASPDPSASPDPTASPDPSASPSLDLAGDQLPVTSGVRLLPILLIGGFLLVGLGTSLYYITRRRVDFTP